MSLAEQLQNLRIPGLQAVNVEKHASILFGKKTAASLDNESILAIAQSGLQDLKSIDPIFERFGSSLFSSASLRIERSIIGKQDNQQLSELISEFLFLVSPYVQLKPAQKCLEWFVRRFQVHVHDKDSLMACMLPYHETQLFGRVIQLFGTKPIGDRWDWLVPCQKDGQGFSSTSLVKHCSEKKHMFVFLWDMALKVAEVGKLRPLSGLTIFYPFIMRTLVAVVENFSKISEEFVGSNLPYLYEGLKSGNKELVICSYTVLMAIGRKVALAPEVVKALFSYIIKVMKPAWYEAGIICLMALASCQDLKIMSKKAYNQFLKLDWSLVIRSLITLKADLDLSPLVNLLIPQLCKSVVSGESATEKEIKILTSLVDDLVLSDKDISCIIRLLMQGNIDLAISTNNQHHCEDAMKLLQSLCRRYSVLFDAQLKDLYAELEASKQTSSMACLNKLAKSFLASAKYVVINESKLPLVVSLNHPEASIRAFAVRQLFDLYHSNVGELESEYFIEAVTARLHDDDVGVVNSVLANSKSLQEIIGVDKTMAYLMSALESKVTGIDLNPLVVTVLRSASESLALGQKFSFAMMGFTFEALSTGATKQLFKAIQSTEGEINSPILRGVRHAVKKLTAQRSGKPADRNMCWVLLTCICDELSLDNAADEIITELWEYRSTLPKQHNMHFLTSLLSCLVVLKTGSLKLIDRITSFDLDSFFTVLGRKHKKHLGISQSDEETSVEPGVSPCLDECRKIAGMWVDTEIGDQKSQESIKGMAVICLLRAVMKTLVNTETYKAHASCYENLVMFACKTRIFSILADLSARTSQPCHSATVPVFRALLSEFFLNHFGGRADLLQFLAYLCEQCLDEGALSSDRIGRTSVCAVHLIGHFINAEDVEYIMSSSALIIPINVALLAHKHSTLRSVAVRNLSAVLTAMQAEKTNPVKYLLQKIVDSSEEIVLDFAHVQRLLEKLSKSASSSKVSDFEKLLSSTKQGKKSLNLVLDALAYLTDIVCWKTDSVHLQLGLMHALALVHSESVLLQLAPALHHLLGKECKLSASEVELVRGLISKFDGASVCALESNKDLYSLFLKLVVSQHCAVQEAALSQISSAFFAGMRTHSNQKELLQTLLKVLVSTKSSSVATRIGLVFDRICISGELAADLFREYCAQIDQDRKANKSKRKRTRLASGNDSSDSEDSAAFIDKESWQSMTKLLEAIQKQSDLAKGEALIPVLFLLLERCLEVTDSSVEYAKQLIFTTMLTLMNKEGVSVDEGKFKFEVLVESLQKSSNLQTSQQCLAVLSRAAALIPRGVIDSIMHVFTFMGGTLLQVDDENSFRVMETTIDAVVPILMEKGDSADAPLKRRKRNAPDGKDEIVTLILETFVDSAPYCPEHRRLHIFSHLIKVLGVDDYLDALIILLIKKTITRPNVLPKSQESRDLSPVTLEFCKDLLQSFPVVTEIDALRKLVAHLNALPEANAPGGGAEKRPRVKKVATLRAAFDASTYSDKQLRLFKYTAVAFLEGVLSSDKVQVGYSVKPSRQGRLTDAYLRFLEELLYYTEGLGKAVDAHAAEDSGKFWRSLLARSHHIVGVVYALLPFDAFINIASGLLDKDSPLIRKKSLELLCSRLAGDSELTSDNELELLSLTQNLLERVKTGTHSDGSDEAPMNKQQILFLLKVLAKRLAVKHKQSFTEMLPVLAKLCDEKQSGHHFVCVSASLCIAELCVQLTIDVLPHMELFMKPILRMFDFADEQKRKSDVFFVGAISALHKIVVATPQFVSPYMSDIVTVTCSADAFAKVTSNSSLLQKVTALKQDVAKCVVPRVLLPTVNTCLDSYCLAKVENLPCLLDLLKMCFETISKVDANSNHAALILDVFKKAFDVRSRIADNENLCADVERAAIGAMCNLVLKLSENTFRPMYLELFTWATQSDQSPYRILSFYHLSIELARSLKSLFLLFVGHVLKNATELLRTLNQRDKDPTLGRTPVDREYSKKLLTAVLDCLAATFMYDNQGFVNGDRFNSMMAPLVNQLENNLFDDAEYSSFVADHLLPALVNFAAAVNDASCFKPLNDHLLLKTTSANEKVRLATLQIVEQLYKKLGEGYVIVVPETIPFLAELLEDDSPAVEEMCQKLISCIEHVSGETLQKYM